MVEEYFTTRLIQKNKGVNMAEEIIRARFSKGLIEPLDRLKLREG